MTLSLLKADKMNGNGFGLVIVVIIIVVVILFIWALIPGAPGAQLLPPLPPPFPQPPQQPPPQVPPPQQPPQQPPINLPETVNITLSPSEETHQVKLPVGRPMPSGTLQGRLSGPPGNRQFQFTSTAMNLTTSITGIHFHQAPRGQPGPIIKDLTQVQRVPMQGGGWQISSVWTSGDSQQPLTETLYQALRQGQLYLNWHTTLNPDGEIRGQLEITTF